MKNELLARFSGDSDIKLTCNCAAQSIKSEFYYEHECNYTGSKLINFFWGTYSYVDGFIFWKDKLLLIIYRSYI